jgi:hypothetical protein
VIDLFRSFRTLPKFKPVAQPWQTDGRGRLCFVPGGAALREVPRELLLFVVLTHFEIRHLFISAGHNYFGRHGKPPCDHAMMEVERLQCVTSKGIAGDRFFGFKKEYKGQITFFEEEVYQDLCLQFGVWDRTPEAFRRNVITRGVRLKELIGQGFELQGVRFFGNEECRPCYWMDLAFAPGAENALQGRGGLRASILSDGFLTRSISGEARHQELKK